MIIPTMQTTDRQLKPPKFIRRADLSPAIRIQIACAAVVAKMSGQWGVITELARQYVVSRTFIYMLAANIQQRGNILFCEPYAFPPKRDEKMAYYSMLSLRLEGRCSIAAISTIMSRFGVSPSSTGTISQTLQSIGHLLPNTLCTQAKEIRLVVFLSDELFAHGHPILVTVEPQSSALLRVELVQTRQWEQWKQHWECLETNGYYALYLVSDEGQALSKAQKETLKNIVRQPDTYHAIAHRLGRYVLRLEAAAYTAISQEYEAERKIKRAATAATRKQGRTAYTRTKIRTENKIARADNYRYLYHCLLDELRLFDETGQLRNRRKAEGNMHAALALLESLGMSSINKVVKTINLLLPELLNYFDVANTVMANLQELPCDPETLKMLCLAWQWHKALIKAKTPPARHYCADQEAFYLELADDDPNTPAETMKTRVYQQLDQIVHSSSLVECLNSIIRPYLNTTKNHVTQDLLNLVMFYHNHRRYRDGKRKGHTPMELLTGKPQEQDWIDLVFEVIEQTQPMFFSSAR